MALTVNSNAFEAYRGKPDKGRLIATYRGERTDRVPNFEVLIEDDHGTRILGHPAGNTLGVGGEAASCHSIVNYMPDENFVTMINAIHKYGRY